MSPNPIAPPMRSYHKFPGSKSARMGYWLFPLLIFNFSFLILQCGLDIEDPTPPSPPQWVTKSLPEEWPERGIDAHESGGIVLEWQFNGSEEIARYCIYRAEHDDLIDSILDYILVINLDAENLEEFSFVDQSIVIGKKYYYKIHSIDTANNRSEFSDCILYKSTPKVDESTLSPNSTTIAITKSRGLSWNSYYHMEMENYIITLMIPPQQIIIRSLFNPQSYIGRETWTIPDSVSLDSGQVYHWRIDTGAEYINGIETAGSESAWARFLYTGL